MTEILSSASYIQNHEALRNGGAQKLDEVLRGSGLGSEQVSRRAWQLLETPQTVGTLCRTLKNEQEAPSAAQMEKFMAQLFAQDLIQVSPDT